MIGQQIARRFILWAMVALVAVAALGPGYGASADNREADHESAENFKAYCKTLGGTYSTDGLGNTKCTYKGGDYTECDASGNDCWYIPKPRQAQPDDPFDPYDGSDGQVSDDPGGTDAPAPVADTPGPAGAQPGVAANAGDQDHDQDHDKRKGKGKKGKKGGKGRKK